MRAELIFIPALGVGHLVSAFEFAKLLVCRDERISISILIMKYPTDSSKGSLAQNLKKEAPERIAFVDIPELDETTRTELMSLPRKSFFTSFMESQRALVKDVVTTITKQSESAKLGGFVIDMFCASMIDVAKEFNVPSYVYFTSGAAFLSLKFYVQNLKDNESKEISEYKDSDDDLSIPGFINPVPVKVLPSVIRSKEWSTFIIAIARRLREAKAILVNTFWELESHAIKSLADDENTPLIYHIGPIINFKSGGATTDKKMSEEEIVCWLDCQPPLSVVYLCFGSMGSFDPEQVTEIAQALELSGQRFLWSLRRPSQEKEKMQPPTDYEDFNEVLPEGFLERTSGIGKVIGWAPQVTVLSHPSVGGFVSHCGWNSTLESVWCGVPMATWPLSAEQQLNAFQLVKELGIATEIKMDYRKDNLINNEAAEVLTADVIERGIRCVMDGESEIRSKMKEMKDKCREATLEAGSSYTSLGQFIDSIIDNVQDGGFN
ncbi:Glycosyltransferase [Heracleum sosnowskyi]|uniref:Glycosyltransferase n=1 Tax=Heracleum sosnowskyi TaxID=360622 RepID=A0AAD8IYQ9_9APIA|nr:Glycosyltransferase [Heracleum sosnowskyi]